MSSFDDAMSLVDEADLDAAEDLASHLAAQDAKFLEGLVAHRAASGLTQADLAAAWGRHKTAVSQFEQPGNDPKLSTIRRYAASAGIRYHHFVSFDSTVHRPSDSPIRSVQTAYSDTDVWGQTSTRIAQ
ncbi:helix-turn-helix domain-containing protein [Gordonia sp. HY002]|uniref:helix-turn-helix domain-containing protein n=1 Tax=Gordonia zhenghanii TaxID=2911516 RepID=UPI001F2E0120|nr:helix-turn-helix transcriptional regulator [Gordonia zhenghanii]MCF8570452.1 helix-turn-helix domain-containing protein [Gordonia zhenghanii]MCF8602591.1 helix-turn-helix domain-containing protein [Gordonia zhenghanii]